MSGALFPVPTVQGLDINGVIYQYTPIKRPEDDFTVTVQNARADGSGYIFSETDNWSGRPGITINRLVPLPYTPLSDFGDGEILTTGTGVVESPSVVYTFRQDPCINPQSNPSCPGYVDPSVYLPEIDSYDALNDPNVMASMEPTDPSLYEDEEGNKKDKEEEDDGRLEKALAAAENALTIGVGVSQASILQAMNTATNMNNYYAAQITGGVYKETTVLQDKNIPDNRRALRSLGQQRLHTDMVNQQYGR